MNLNMEYGDDWEQVGGGGEGNGTASLGTGNVPLPVSHLPAVELEFVGRFQGIMLFHNKSSQTDTVSDPWEPIFYYGQGEVANQAMISCANQTALRNEILASKPTGRGWATVLGVNTARDGGTIHWAGPGLPSTGLNAMYWEEMMYHSPKLHLWPALVESKLVAGPVTNTGSVTQPLMILEHWFDYNDTIEAKYDGHLDTWERTYIDGFGNASKKRTVRGRGFTTIPLQFVRKDCHEYGIEYQNQGTTEQNAQELKEARKMVSTPWLDGANRDKKVMTRQWISRLIVYNHTLRNSVGQPRNTISSGERTNTIGIPYEFSVKCRVRGHI